MKKNQDVASAGVNPLIHYLKCGWREERNPNIFFDNGYYLLSNHDVADAKWQPLIHYATHGCKEGRATHLAFDPAFYLETNQDVKEAGASPLIHYLSSGKNEGRAPSRQIKDISKGLKQPNYNRIIEFIIS